MRFDYLQPSTVDECVGLLAKHGKNAKIIAGGTDLMLKTRARMVNPKYVVDVGDINDLRRIADDGVKGLRIGSCVTVREVESSPLVKERYQLLATAAGLIGSVGIRNVATIGGNICNASPSAETLPALLCLSAEVRIVGPKGERMVPLGEFFVGPGATVLGQDELLTEVLIPAPKPGTKGVYLKNSPRGSIDLAIVGVAAVGTFDPASKACTEIKVALGAVAATPIRAKNAEKILQGKVFDDALIAAAAQAAADEARPINDVRASAEYRREMVRVFTRRALETLLFE